MTHPNLGLSYSATSSSIGRRFLGNAQCPCQPNGLHREAQPRSRQDGRQAPKLGVAGLGQNPVRRLSREPRTPRDGTHPTMGHGNLAQGEHQRSLMSLLDGCFDVGSGLGGILQPLDEPIFVREARFDDG